MITKSTELKNSNLTLGSALEEASDKYEGLTTEKHGLENQMENYIVRHLFYELLLDYSTSM